MLGDMIVLYSYPDSAVQSTPVALVFSTVNIVPDALHCVIGCSGVGKSTIYQLCGDFVACSSRLVSTEQMGPCRPVHPGM